MDRSERMSGRICIISYAQASQCRMMGGILGDEIVSVRQQLQEEAVEVMAAIVGATNGAYGGKYGWLRAFDGEELAELGSELHEAYHASRERGDAREFEAVLHEWRESAVAIASSEHEEAYLAEPNPVPLTPPEHEET